MTDSHDSQSPRPRTRSEIWTDVVCPTARGLEPFFWKLLWFAVIVYVLLSYDLIS